MCLGKITKKQVLKKDKQVWKAVKIVGGKEYSYGEYGNGMGSVLLGWTKHKSPMKELVGTVKAEILTLSLEGFTHNNFGNYQSGFHCFLRKKDADDFIIHFGWHGAKVVDYIIPAGTPVLYGKQSDRTVIVTPILKNPRIPSEH